MNEHFRTFSFVDKIVSVDVGISIASRYTIPGDIEAFPILLVAEAIGQSAAWSAMAAVDFRFRPVAGLTQKVEVFSSVHPGQTLELAAKLESVDTEAVAYSGAAHVNGTTIARLEHSVGPMMPLEDFDDPSAVRERFALLRGPGADPGSFRGVPALELKLIGDEKGSRKTAMLQVPLSAPFFADHFPRRPVFPGTMLMGSNLDLAAILAKDIPLPAPNRIWKLRSTMDAKFRTFTPPGANLECEASLESQSDHELCMAMQSRDGKRIVASAKARFVDEEGP